MLALSCLFAKNCHRVFPLPSQPRWESRKETQPLRCPEELEGPLCPRLSPGFPQLGAEDPELGRSFLVVPPLPSHAGPCVSTSLPDSGSEEPLSSLGLATSRSLCAGRGLWGAGSRMGVALEAALLAVRELAELARAPELPFPGCQPLQRREGWLGCV